jgi:hypothetical protein
MELNEMGFQEALTEALFTYGEENGIKLRTRTFEEAVILTSNKGLVVTMNGCEFQVTIVQSKGGR